MKLARSALVGFRAAIWSSTRSARSFHLTTMAPEPQTSPSPQPADYTKWDNAKLIQRITDLEQQLSKYSTGNGRTSEPSPRRKTKNPGTVPSLTIDPMELINPSVPAGKGRNFDFAKYNTRFIALKFAYLGQRYNGYEHTNGNTTPLTTIEEELWKALRRTRLIFTPGLDDLDNPKQEPKSPQPYMIDWEGCEYSKCGRTDRGVSAFGQVIGIRVRSARPKPKPKVETSDGGDAENVEMENAAEIEKEWDDVADELPYIQMLNSLLPEDIRVLAWCPNPPPDFSARFSCRQRRYRYFFTQPAFLPTPGPLGFVKGAGDGKQSAIREGYLDIEAMREGAKNYMGSHDFRNFCKVDTSKQITNFTRDIAYAGIEEVDMAKTPLGFLGGSDFRESQGEIANNASVVSNGHSNSPGKVYSFTVHGNAFLWHQIRHMVAMLFLIGQGFEKPSIVTELLDISKNPQRPTYEMASDMPLVLWDCIFEDKSAGVNELEWVYAGDARSQNSRSGKGDGKFGQGGVVEQVWSVWRQRKIDEVLAGTLLDLVVSQGDQSSLQRGGFRHPGKDKEVRTPKVFYGGNIGKYGGAHVPLLKRRRLDTVEVQNARYMAKGKNKDKKKAKFEAQRGT